MECSDTGHRTRTHNKQKKIGKDTRKQKTIEKDTKKQESPQVRQQNGEELEAQVLALVG